MTATRFCMYYYFNPRPPWGGRRRGYCTRRRSGHFNPRPPWGGRPALICSHLINAGFQSTPSVGRATFPLRSRCRRDTISIHALRGEGDQRRRTGHRRHCGISIHALRGEGDRIGGEETRGAQGFQSTPSVGRATRRDLRRTHDGTFQSTPSVGRATSSSKRYPLSFLFQSTPSVGRATVEAD